MKTSARGRALIERWEGKFLKAYHGAADRPGLLTIGYGHTDAAGPPKVTAGMTITEQEADQILANDLAKVERNVSNMVKVPLNQNQFDVLVSFVFNLGEGNLKSSSLLKKLNAGKYDEVPAEIVKWNKANGKFVQGLANRRADEVKLWNAPVTPDNTAAHGSAGAVVIAGGAAATQAPHHLWPWIIGGTILAALIVWGAIYLYKKGKKNESV